VILRTLLIELCWIGHLFRKSLLSDIIIVLDLKVAQELDA